MGLWTKMIALAERLGEKARENGAESSLLARGAAHGVGALELVAWFDAAHAGDARALREVFEMDPRWLDCPEPASANGLGGHDGGATALHLAASAGHLDALNLLLSLGADANALDSSGMDALMIAASNKEWGAIKALLPVSDAKRKNHGGVSALMWVAIGSLRSTATVQQWRDLALKSDPAARDQNGCTALIMAARAGNAAAVEALLPLTPMEPKDDDEGLRAWEWAWENKDFALLDLMAAHPASEAWRGEVAELIKNGPLSAQDLPKTWAIHEAGQLREAVGGAAGKTPKGPSREAGSIACAGSLGVESAGVDAPGAAAGKARARRL